MQIRWSDGLRHLVLTLDDWEAIEVQDSSESTVLELTNGVPGAGARGFSLMVVNGKLHEVDGRHFEILEAPEQQIDLACPAYERHDTYVQVCLAPHGHTGEHEWAKIPYAPDTTGEL
jgi:hypothetical protein